MSASRITLVSLPSFCQKLSKLVEIWQSSDKNNFAKFFLRHGVRSILSTTVWHLTFVDIVATTATTTTTTTTTSTNTTTTTTTTTTNTTNKQVTFHPEIVLQHVSQHLSALVANERVTIESNASQTVHSVQIRPTISQAVFPRLIVPKHRLVLKLSNNEKTITHITAIQLLTQNNVGRNWRHICLLDIRNVSALEVLCNRALQINIYYLLSILLQKTLHRASTARNTEASAKLTTANGGTFTWAQLDSVANHVTARSIGHLQW